VTETVRRRARAGRRHASKELLLGLVLMVGAAGLGVVALRPDLVRPAAAYRDPQPGGFRFGVQLDWVTDTPGGYADRLGLPPAILGEYLDLPLTDEVRDQALRHARAAATVGAAYLLTVTSSGGLGSVTQEAADAIASLCAAITGQRVPVVLRFGHEMNASWYAWGEQPTEYVDAYRRVALAVRHAAPGVALAWGPNYGGGYPFPGGPFEAQAGRPGFAASDTDHDGRLTAADDPYAPYYPGDDVVDIVGLTMYHWGNGWPWGENEVPTPGEFRSQVRGTYQGPLGDQRPVPDFYADYAQKRGKPFAVFETAALSRPSNRGGDTEADIKRTWIAQVLDPTLRVDLPAFTLALWFEHAKQETDTGFVDWRATADPDLAAYLRDRLLAAGYPEGE